MCYSNTFWTHAIRQRFYLRNLGEFDVKFEIAEWRRETFFSRNRISWKEENRLRSLDSLIFFLVENVPCFRIASPSEQEKEKRKSNRLSRKLSVECEQLQSVFDILTNRQGSKLRTLDDRFLCRFCSSRSSELITTLCLFPISRKWRLSIDRKLFEDKSCCILKRNSILSLSIVSFPSIDFHRPE